MQDQFAIFNREIKTSNFIKSTETSRDPCKAQTFYFFRPGMMTGVLLQWVFTFRTGGTVDGTRYCPYRVGNVLRPVIVLHVGTVYGTRYCS
jgi:hypothetical protein